MAVVEIKEGAFRNWLAKQIALAKNTRTLVPSVLISPDDAEVILEGNDINRRINNTHVSLLAKEMTTGKWLETGETIKLDRAGRLLDGQHRLMAIRSASVSIKLDFAFGVETEAFDRIDVGKIRTNGNVFEIAGYANGAAMAAAARAVIAAENGYKSLMAVKPSRHELLEFVRENPDMVECAKIGAEMGRGIGKAGSKAGLAAGAFFIRKRMGEDESGQFFTKVATGIGLTADSPILAFRNRCIRSADGRPLDAVDVAALLIKAFNYWHEGRPSKMLVWRSIEEDFPVVGG